MMLLNKRYNNICKKILHLKFCKLLKNNQISIHIDNIKVLNNITKTIYTKILMYLSGIYKDLNKGSIVIINLSRASRTYVDFKSMKYYNRYFLLIDDSVYDSIEVDALNQAITTSCIQNKKIKLFHRAE